MKKAARKLKYKKDFEPAYAKADDEMFPNGIFEFNISRMIEFIRNNGGKVILEDISTEKYHIEAFSCVNEDHIDTVDITKPIILIEIKPEHYAVVDGHHRLEKAYREGVLAIPAFKLRMEQHINFMTSIKAYEAYIDYWNEKLGEQ